MFRFFRKNREKVLKYLLVFFLGIVSLGMVITLAPIPGGDTSQTSSNVLASLNGTDITTQDLQRTLDSQFRNSPLRNTPAIMAQMAGNILDEMIFERALIAQARKMGLEVSNTELTEAIQTMPGLSVDGKFVGMDQYRNIVEAQGQTVPQFEEQMRESLLEQKLRDVITDAVQVTPEDIHQEFLKRNEKVKVAYVVFDPSQYVKAVQVTPQALQAFYESAKLRYKLPEERRIRYVLIDADSLRSQIKITDAQLKEYYAQHLQDYRVPERVKAAHILFKTTDKTPQEITEITQKAQDVLKQIRGGADFAEMAKKDSDDTTASKGGDLGWITRGQTVKEFEDAAFSMKPGQVSDLVKTTYGIHIIKVFDHQPAHTQSFDEVKGAIQDTLEKQQLAQLQSSVSEQLQKALKADPEHFAAVAGKFGYKVQETTPFKYNQAVPDLGNDQGLENLAFQLRVGEVGQPLNLAKGVVIIQLAQIIPEHVPSLDEVRTQAEEDYRSQQSRVLAQEKAAQFAEKAKAGDFQKVAQAEKLTVKESKDFSRQDDVGDSLTGSQLAAAFTMKPGQTGDVTAAGGNYVVFKVVAHTAPDETTFGQQQSQIREQLLDEKRNLAFELYRKNLKEALIRSGDLKMNDANLKQFLAAYTRS